MKALALVAAAALLTGAAPFDPFHEARIDARPAGQVPLDLRFIDSDGRPTTLRAVADGKAILLVPVLHDCPNICGVTLGSLTDALARQPGPARHAVAVVAFGIDPKETPADAAADRRRNPRLDAAFLVGDAAQVHAVTDALGYRYAYDPRIRQIAHIAATAALTPDGRLVRWVNGIAPEPADLGRAIADARAERTGGFVRAIALLCYHYDPQTGRYSLAITRIVQAAGIVMVLLIGGAIVLLNRRAV